jgi:hypothetical protein
VRSFMSGRPSLSGQRSRINYKGYDDSSGLQNNSRTNVSYSNFRQNYHPTSYWYHHYPTTYSSNRQLYPYH